MKIIYDTPEIIAKEAEIEATRVKLRQLEIELHEMRRAQWDVEHNKEIERARKLTPTRYGVLKVMAAGHRLQFSRGIRSRDRYSIDYRETVSSATADALITAKYIEKERADWRGATYVISESGRKAYYDYAIKMKEKGDE